MTPEQRDEIFELYPDTLRMDGYDESIIGIAERFGMDTVIAYDKNKVLAVLQAQGMSEDEAWEFFYFNQVGAWLGDTTPVFVTVFSDED